MYTNKGNKATKKGFSEGLLYLGEKYKDVVLLGSDITSSVGMGEFAERYPDRFFSMGIAEQNCAGAAAGLALAGKVPVYSTYGVFAGIRAADQVRVSICYNNVHVIIGGAHAGISVGSDGATHQALEDIAMMRVLPNMTIISPCDATQTKLATMAAYEQVFGPVYVRFGRAPVPDYSSPDLEFNVGKAQTLREGDDISIIATGHLVWEALLAANELLNSGINARVINMHTIKPIDESVIIKAAKETGAIITAEEHQKTGGLGSAVAEVMVNKHPVPMSIIGMNDRFGESGKPEELMEKYGMTAAEIVKRAKELLS